MPIPVTAKRRLKKRRARRPQRREQSGAKARGGTGAESVEEVGQLAIRS